MNDAPAPARRWFGHPPGLTILFLTEMWEVFSLYGMRAILVLYLTKALGFSPARASMIFGLYAAFSFLTPLAGSIVADTWLGRRRAVALGSVIMAAGHFMMMSDGLLFPALAVIALGNGLFMPNLASQIDGLYAREDPARGRAFNLYYVGVNLGGFLAPLVCGALGEWMGWHWGFGAAGLGMLVGLCVFLWGQRHLPSRDGPREHHDVIADESVSPGLLACVLVLVILFRGSYEQAGNTIALWASDHLDRGFAAGGVVPVSWFQALNPLFVFTLTPLLLRLWKRRPASPSAAQSLRTMSIGAATVCTAFCLLAGWSALDGRPPWLSLVIFFALYTWGEIQVLPVGLALFGRAASPRFASLAFAIWFAAAFFGNLLAGFVGATYSMLGPPVFFALVSGFALAAAAGFFALGLERLKHPRNEANL